MTVLRIVANIATPSPEAARRFYGEVLGLAVVMDLGWILTFAAPGNAPPQLSIASEGGAGLPVPDLSIEVDDLDDTCAGWVPPASRWNTAPSPSPGASRAASSATPSAGW